MNAWYIIFYLFIHFRRRAISFHEYKKNISSSSHLISKFPIAACLIAIRKRQRKKCSPYQSRHVMIISDAQWSFNSPFLFIHSSSFHSSTTAQKVPFSSLFTTFLQLRIFHECKKWKSNQNKPKKISYFSRKFYCWQKRIHLRILHAPFTNQFH